MDIRFDESDALSGKVLAHPSGLYFLVGNRRGGGYEVAEYALVEAAGAVSVRENARHAGVDGEYLKRFKPAPRPVAEAIWDFAAYRRASSESYAGLVDAEGVGMFEAEARSHAAAAAARDAARAARARAGR